MATGAASGLRQVLEGFFQAPEIRECVTAWRVLPPRPALTEPFPAWLDPRLEAVLRRAGIEVLYSHQARAVEAVRRGKNVVVVTPTASGKTLCYNLPVLQTLLERPQARALYLFPTKALSQDQVAELHRLVELLEADIKTCTYDGDTPGPARKAIRQAGHVVVTNPDMLHRAVLPHHTKWVKLFENLQYLVIDEVHQYRGVFGSHVANVLRRLRRVCRFYGSDPRVILCSATIANPRELAEQLIEAPVECVSESGAPAAEKHFIFYNPPVINRQLQIRRSSLLEGTRLARACLRQGVQTIVFGRSRVAVEVILSYLREALQPLIPGFDQRVRGYRGGYLPSERRAIERGLRQGQLLGVVSTNALELGIDVGQLEACIMVGYPGNVASTWQQAGRAGRRAGSSLAVLVADSSPLDQYIATHPDYFFGTPPEHAWINPDNLLILMAHLKCAAFELPFVTGEAFGRREPAELLDYLADHGVLHRSGDRWHWMADAYPAEGVSLRSAPDENFVVVDTTRPKPEVIGEVDRFSAPMLIHEEAIYLHEGRQYQVERLDWEAKKALVKQVSVDYYTDADLAVSLRVLDEFQRAPLGSGFRGHGEAAVTAKTTLFKKIKFHTHENVGSGPIHLPQQELHTAATWFALGPAETACLDPDAVQTALVGIGQALVNVVPLHCLCDRRDLLAVTETRSPFTGLPTIYLADRYPGGVGLAEKVFSLHARVFRAARELIAGCRCTGGCPSCVGPAALMGPEGKGRAVAVLDALLAVAGAAPAVTPTRAATAPAGQLPPAEGLL